MKMSNIVFGGALHPEPGSLIGFEVEEERLPGLRASGQFEILVGTRVALRRRGEWMAKEWDALGERDQRMCKVLTNVRAGPGVSAKPVETGELEGMDMDFVMGELDSKKGSMRRSRVVVKKDVKKRGRKKV